ncbi:hypothetical protein [Paracoccus denitrificans]|uniref:hypothetical protein n=1 Tax=Paracoccus denitrificans TaxID=266 RepID=UPI000CEC025F|nr:hypothetical protein [Paracoccus denitrificans]
MCAYHVYEHAPLGSLIRFCDGTPRPAEEQAAEVQAWEKRNGTGLLAMKDPSPEQRSWVPPTSITLRMPGPNGEAANNGDLSLTFSVDSDLRFEILARPSAGTFRVLRGSGSAVELLGIAGNRAEAQQYLRACPAGAGFRIEEETADDHAADVVEGRSASVRVAIPRPTTRPDRLRVGG